MWGNMADPQFSRSPMTTGFSEQRPSTAGVSRPVTSMMDMPAPFQRPETGQTLASFQGEGAGSRPSTSGRPLTARPLGSALRGVPGTASRLVSTAALQRPSTRAGVATGIGLTTPINVTERLITQQGLSAMKTPSRGHQRQVQDKSYYMGLLRTKTSDLTGEITRLTQEIEIMTQEQSTFLTYDRKVKEVAQELTALQGSLADYNMLVDLMNTDTEQAEVDEDIKDLKDTNDEQMAKLDAIFVHKQEKETRMRQIEAEIEEERHMGENLLGAMQPELRDQYIALRDTNARLLQSMDLMQREVDGFEARRKTLQDELAISKVKQEAVALFTKLQEIEEKRDEIIAENQKRGTPQEERDKLIAQVKEDNADIATMERQMAEIQDEIGRAQEEIHHLDQELEENRSERSQKYRELKKKEEAMEQFMESFEVNKSHELERLKSIESTIVALLEKLTKNMAYFGNFPSSQDFSLIKSDLSFKQGELHKSQYTEHSLQAEHLNLQANLQKIEALQTKVQKEKLDIDQKMQKMQKEYETFLDIVSLRKKMEEKRTNLVGEKDELDGQKQSITESLKEATDQVNLLKKQLSDNETHGQLLNLEKKWSHLEQNNFVLKEFIAQKRSESNFLPLKTQAIKLVTDYNKHLQEIYQSGSALY